MNKKNKVFLVFITFLCLSINATYANQSMGDNYMENNGMWNMTNSFSSTNSQIWTSTNENNSQNDFADEYIRNAKWKFSTVENLDIWNDQWSNWNLKVLWNADLSNAKHTWDLIIEWDLDMGNATIEWNVIVKWNANLWNAHILGSLLVLGTLDMGNADATWNIYVYWWYINWYNSKWGLVEKLEKNLSLFTWNVKSPNSKIKVLWSVDIWNTAVESFYMTKSWKRDTWNFEILKQFNWYFWTIDPFLDINLDNDKRLDIKSFIDNIEWKVSTIKGWIAKEITNNTNAKRQKKSYDLTKLNQLKQEIYNLKYDLVNDEEIISSINNIDYDKEEFKKAQLNEIKDTITYINSIIGNKFDNQSIKKEVNSVTSINTNWNGVSINSNGTSINTNWNGVSINSNGTSINSNGSNNASVNSNKSTDDKLKSSLRLFIEKKLDWYTEVQKSKIIEILPWKIDKIVSKTQSEKSKKTLLALKEVVIEMQEEYSNKDEINNLFESLNNND